jgi:hypothetical protein
MVRYICGRDREINRNGPYHGLISEDSSQEVKLLAGFHQFDTHPRITSQEFHLQITPLGGSL